jgi:hypothetical protein
MPTEIKGVPEPNRRGPGAPAVAHAKAPMARVVRPGQYANGENQEGTPAAGEHTDARTQRYKDGDQHHKAEGSSAYPGSK